MKATTVREELIVALFGDAADLITRLEALAPVMNDTRLGMAKAAKELAAQAEHFHGHMHGIASTEQYRAVHYMREHTEHTAHFWQQKQLGLLKEAGRSVLKEEVRSTLNQLLSSLDQLISSLERTSTRLKRRDSVLLHVANTAVSVAATACVAAFLVTRLSAETAASSRPAASVESPCPAPAVAPPERARVRK